MENLLKEMNGRLEYLQSLEQTPETEIRINEITLSIVRVQQIILDGLNFDKRVLAKKLYLDSGIVDNAYSWHIWKRAFDMGWLHRGIVEDKL